MLFFHSHVQVTFKVWRQANFVTVFGIKRGLKFVVASIIFNLPPPWMLTLL